MKLNDSRIELVRQSFELIQESKKLKQRAKETLSKSAAIIDRSRELLAERKVSGSPTFGAEREGFVSSRPEVDPGLAREVDSSTSQEAALERVEGKDFVDETVCLDDRHFINCTLRNCVLEYYGSHLMLESTTFTGAASVLDERQPGQLPCWSASVFSAESMPTPSCHPLALSRALRASTEAELSGSVNQEMAYDATSSVRAGAFVLRTRGTLIS